MREDGEEVGGENGGGIDIVRGDGDRRAGGAVAATPRVRMGEKWNRHEDFYQSRGTHTDDQICSKSRICRPSPPSTSMKLWENTRTFVQNRCTHDTMAGFANSNRTSPESRKAQGFFPAKVVMRETRALAASFRFLGDRICRRRVQKKKIKDQQGKYM